MKIVLASQSPIKKAALEKAAARPDWRDVTIITADIQPDRKVAPELPQNEQVVAGAENRMDATRERYPDADYRVVVESGVFWEDGKRVDRAVVIVESAQGGKTVKWTEGLEVPADIFEESQRLGKNFEKLMVEKGKAGDPRYVNATNPKDVHLAVTGRSKVDFIADAISAAFHELSPPATVQEPEGLPAKDRKHQR